MVSPKEFFTQLHLVMTGKAGEQSSTVGEYEHLSPSKGLEKAIKYYKWARRLVDSAQSDGGYWAAEGDRALAAVLVAFFKQLNEKQKNFPPLVVNDGAFLMDKQAQLENWAVQLVSDHKHMWESCSHTGVGSKGSHPKCKKICEFGGLIHNICRKCSLEQYNPAPIEAIVNT